LGSERPKATTEGQLRCAQMMSTPGIAIPSLIPKGENRKRRGGKTPAQYDVPTGGRGGGTHKLFFGNQKEKKNGRNGQGGDKEEQNCG